MVCQRAVRRLLNPSRLRVPLRQVLVPLSLPNGATRKPGQAACADPELEGRSSAKDNCDLVRHPAKDSSSMNNGSPPPTRFVGTAPTGGSGHATA